MAAIVGLDLVLRLVGYGSDLHLFTETEVLGRKVWEINRDVALRFFPKEMARRPSYSRFPAVKAPGTYRVFSLGESTTAGDPYGAEASYSAFLQEMLRDAYPNRSIEVVNCGIVAISTIDILDLLPEILQHEPDAILIYAGHNEAYGVDAVLSGVRGTVSSRRVMKARLWIRNTRVGRLAQDVLYKLRTRPRTAPKNFGMELMQGKVLPCESRLHRRMLEIYRENLEEMIAMARRRGVDVILCTEVANLRDQSPFGSAHGPGFSSVPSSAWDRAFDAGEAAMKVGRPDEALGFLKQAEGVDSCYAELRFRAARCLDGADHGHDGTPPTASDSSRTAIPASRIGSILEPANREYQAALDEDIVPFRACSDENAIVRSVAAANAGPHFLLVDLERDLARASPDGIPGREFMTEHVHPYIRGHAFLADRICRTFAESQLGARLGAADLSRLGTADAYMSRLGLSDGDEAAGLVLTLNYKLTRWPFTGAYENQAAQDYLRVRIQQIAHGLDPITTDVLSDFATGRLPEGYDYGYRHQEIAARAMAAHDFGMAISEFRLCERYWGPHAELTANMAQAFLLEKNYAEADSLCDLAQSLDPALARVHYLRGVLRTDQNQPDEAAGELREYLRLDPNGDHAAAARRMLQQLGG